MYARDDDQIRAFPSRSTAEASGLTDYIELSGCNGLLIEAVKKLYAVPNKPENPVEWLRLYFKYLAQDVTAAGVADSEFTTRDMDDAELTLKMELVQIEADIVWCMEQEVQNKTIIEKLENEVKHVTLVADKNQCQDDFQKYLKQGGDYHYRVRPDPLYQPSKTDRLMEKDEQERRQDSDKKEGAGRFGDVVPTNQDESIVELVAHNQTLWPSDGASQRRISAQQDRISRETSKYDDYTKIYFPERVVEDADENGDEDENEEEEEDEDGGDEAGDEIDEMYLEADGKAGTMKRQRTRGSGGSEYDGGSEGESEMESRLPKVKSAYTPRSAHDKKVKDKRKSTINKEKKTKGANK